MLTQSKYAMQKDLAGQHGFDHPVVITDAGLPSLIAL